MKDDSADDPAAIVTKLEASGDLDGRLKAIENKAANDNKLGDRLDRIEPS